MQFFNVENIFMIQKKSKINGLTFFCNVEKQKQVMKCHIRTHHQTIKPKFESTSQHLVNPNEPQESWQDRKKPNKEGKSATTPREK